MVWGQPGFSRCVTTAKATATANRIFRQNDKLNRAAFQRQSDLVRRLPVFRLPSRSLSQTEGRALTPKIYIILFTYENGVVSGSNELDIHFRQVQYSVMR